MNKLLLSNEAISIAVRDFFFFLIYHIFRCKVSFNKYYSFNYLSNQELDHYECVAVNISPNHFLYYQQGNKSLKEFQFVMSLKN